MSAKILIIVSLCALYLGTGDFVIVNFTHKVSNATTSILNCWPTLDFKGGERQYTLTIQKEKTVFYSETNFTKSREFFFIN